MSRIGVDLMKTKEEYEKALKEINDAFYGANFLNNQTRRFDDNLNLLRELVNEHFKENIETNFEHYKDEILEDCSQNLAVVKGRPTLCCETNCNNCDFIINQIGCRETAKYWLKQPYKKPVFKLTKFEKELLECYSDECSFKLFNSLNVMKEKGYFKGIDDNESIGDIIAKSEVVG